MPDVPDTLPPQLLERLARCQAELGKIGVVLRGTVVERYMPCGKKGCRCQAQPPALHGPYYQWTMKVDGKTKTVRLTPQEAQVYQAWIANGRRLNNVLAEWENIGIQAVREIREKSRS